jgi:hypothetical protein
VSGYECEITGWEIERWRKKGGRKRLYGVVLIGIVSKQVTAVIIQYVSGGKKGSQCVFVRSSVMHRAAEARGFYIHWRCMHRWHVHVLLCDWPSS